MKKIYPRPHVAHSFALIFPLLLGVSLSCGEKTNFKSKEQKNTTPIETEDFMGEVKHVNVEIPPPPPDPYAPEILETEIYSGSGKDIEIRWKEPEIKEGIGGYLFLVLAEDGSPVLDSFLKVEEINPSDAEHIFTIPKNLLEGRFFVKAASHYEAVENQITESPNSNSAEVIVDLTAPTGELYLGVEPNADACTTPPGSREEVSTRLSPFDFCVYDAGSTPTGVDAVCLKLDGGEEIPPANDSCFVKQDDIFKLLLLSNRSSGNEVKLFIRDRVGNIGVIQDNILLNISKPPVIDILAPSSLSLLNETWKAGEKKTIRWRVTDDDTSLADLKVIVNLVEANNANNFKFLACNFSNSSLWKQCPAKEVESSPDLKIDTLEPNTMKYEFTVPEDFWQDNTQYLITINAIDKFGNAAIVSTPEINAGWEVIAGRTYKGLGGSGTTTFRGAAGNYYISVDKKGQLFDSTLNLKINAFDLRTCRMVSNSQTDITSNDCADIIVTDYKVLSRPWLYSKKDDVFYVQSEGKIIALDFNHRSAKAIIGEGELALTDTGADLGPAKDYKVSSMDSYIFYQESSAHVYFRSNGQFFAIDTVSGNVKYLLGKAGGTTWPPSQLVTPQSEVLITPGGPFAVSDDGRVLMAGQKGQACPSTGSGYGSQYILDGFSLSDPTSKVKLINITNDDGQCAPNPAKNDKDIERGSVNASLSFSPIYDPAKNRFFAYLAWWDTSVMNLPKKGANANEYVWEKLIAGSGPLAENEYLKEQAPTPETVIGIKGWIHHGGPLAYIGSDLLYFAQRDFGNVFTLDLKTRRLERLIGFDIGSEEDQLAINRRLMLPRSVFAHNGDIYFNDYFNLQKVSASQITTVIENFSRSPMHYESNQFFVADRWTLRTYKNFEDLKTPITNTSTTYGSTSYENHYGYANHMVSRARSVYYGSNWNGYDAIVHAFIGLSDYSAIVDRDSSKNGNVTQVLSHSDRYVLGYNADAHTEKAKTQYPGCSGVCAQGTESGNAPLKYYEGASYRVQGIGGNAVWQNTLNIGAFDENDDNYFDCINGSFTRYSVSTKKFFKFSVTLSGKPFSCSSSAGDLFHYQHGILYFANTKGIFQFDSISDIISNGAGVLSPLKVKGQILTGTTYGDIFIEEKAGQKELYYTDWKGGRVLHNTIIP